MLHDWKLTQDFVLVHVGQDLIDLQPMRNGSSWRRRKTTKDEKVKWKCKKKKKKKRTQVYLGEGWVSVRRRGQSSFC
jgi:hypothetical protein